ncbi:DUF2800 domain-containing protein [Mammaliicoccus sp. M-M49]|uniref:DUF2800 domain-containing protein n=1 Tax=Mammaliicoccus sp. M-M49 TaxID=2898708 RepID=UPI001EFAD533|nr:DUF2800 domain-containing protein [Mammaliicoccus sp. M-M49]
MSVNHSDRAHAKLSASAAKQWMNCPPSIKASEGIADKTSVFAEEGTFAHELSELYFSHMYEGLTKRQFNTEFKKRKENEFYNEELHEYVKEYVDLVEERINEAFARVDSKEDVSLLFETRLDLSTYVPESFGTGDVIIYSGGVLEIVDLKFGKGVEVSAIDNPQLRLYALGAYELFNLVEDINEIRMSIIQPRKDNYSTETLSTEELIDWAEKEVKPKALMAYKGEGDFKPGEHCRFCKIKHSCRARAEQNLNTVKAMDEPYLLTNDELADLLYKVSDIKKWADDIEAYCLDQATNNGRQFEGWKLVAGRSSRKYIDKEKVIETLQKHDYDKSDITETKVLSISNLEKRLGKKTVQELLSHLIVKPEGKATLVPESDKRPALGAESAQDEFDEIKN